MELLKGMFMDGVKKRLRLLERGLKDVHKDKHIYNR